MPMRVLRQCLRLALYLHAFPLTMIFQIITPTTALQILSSSRLAYLMVLPVLNLIHCGIGRFCFCALASFCFVLKVLWDCMDSVSTAHMSSDSLIAYRHLDCCL